MAEAVKKKEENPKKKSAAQQFKSALPMIKELVLPRRGLLAFSFLLVLVGLWLPAVVNLSGIKNIGAVQVVTTILKFIALAFMSTVGLFFISTGNFTPWNVSGQSTVGAIGSAMAICLFSYLGVETAAVAAAKVRDPDRNVPKATVLGTLASAVVYLLSMVAIFGIVPTEQLALDENKASYSVAANAMVGSGHWAATWWPPRSSSPGSAPSTAGP